MNYYERVQRAIDYIELNLSYEIDLNTVSKEAFMSIASLYRLFFSMTGFSVKEYIRRRRINEASRYLVNTKRSIFDIAFDFCFESQEAFTRSFKQLTGLTPGAFRKSKAKFEFERVNVVENYLEIQDAELLEKYPDIKVVKELKPVRVAYYRYIGKCPEGKAWKVLLEWIRKVGLDQGDCKMRIFGFDSPPPPPEFIPGETEYGYEFMVTIDEDLVVDDENVKTKVFSGGRYAVMSISNVDGNGIMNGWERFKKWLSASKYLMGTHQWLEEHLSFSDENSESMKIDLYMPLSEQDKNGFENKISVFEVEPVTVAYYRAFGDKPWDEAWKVMLDWAQANDFFSRQESQRFINYSSIPVAYPGEQDFWFEVCMQIDHNTEIEDGRVKKKKFKGGLYACVNTDKKDTDDIWPLLEKWMFANSKYTYSSQHQWFQEQWLDKHLCPEYQPDNLQVKCCAAVKRLKR